MSGNVVTLTFDAKLAPAARAFKQLTDKISENKDAAKGLTKAVRDVGKEYEKNGSTARKWAQDQVNDLGNMVKGLVTVAAAIRVATQAYETFKQGQQAAITAGASVGTSLQRLQNAAGSGAGIARQQAEGVAYQTGSNVLSAYALRTDIEKSTGSFGRRFDPATAMGYRGKLTLQAAQLQSLYGQEGQEGQFAQTLGGTADIYTAAGPEDVGNAVEALLREGASPEEARSILRSFAGKNGGRNELSSAVAFFRSLQNRVKDTPGASGLSTGGILRKIETLKGPQTDRKSRAILQGIGVRPGQFTGADAGALSRASDKSLSALGFTPDEIDAVRGLGQFGQEQAAYGAAQLLPSGETEDVVGARFRGSTLGEGGQMVLGQRNLQRAKNDQLLKEAEESRQAADLAAAKIRAEGTSTLAKMGGQIPFIDALNYIPGAALQGEVRAAQEQTVREWKLEAWLRQANKDAATNGHRTGGDN